MARPPRRETGPRAGGRGLDEPGIARALREGTLPPVLLATGRDYFTRDAVLEGLRKKLVPEGFEAFNYRVFSGEEVSGADLVRQAEPLPMGAGHRLLIVRRAEGLKQADCQVLAEYAASPVPTTVMVLVCGEGRPPVLAALRKAAHVADFPAPRDYQLGRWLEEQASRKQIPLESEAARVLAQIVGDDYVAAMSELERAALNTKGKITARIVEELMTPRKDKNRFHLADAVLSRQPARAVKILRDLYDSGETGYAMLGALEAQLRRFLEMRARVSKGESPRSVVDATSPRLPPGIKAGIARQLQSFDEPALIAAFRMARETDRAIKSHGSGVELAHMESLVWRIAAL